MASDERKDNSAFSNLGESRGFSLLEMMVVITLILVLANIAMPIYGSIIVHAHEAVLREDLFTLRSQIDRFTHDNERGPASLKELVDEGYMGAIPIDPFTGSSDTWRVAEETADSGQSIVGIADVHSGAEGTALDGTRYGEW